MSAMKTGHRLTRGGACGVLVLALSSIVSPRARARAQGDVADRARALIEGLDFDQAHAVLARTDTRDPKASLERARLAIYELDCDGAAAILARPDVEAEPGGTPLADIARGCQRVTASLAIDRDEARAVEVRWQDEHDRALAPLIFETVAKARDALTRDLGVDWPRPTRVVVVRDLLSLSAMTGLPYESAKTTGTVAVAKWGRVTLLSPRASPHGYPWRDTIAHELTHLAVTRASDDKAPLWLQEGIAKREESRWREPGPFDDRPAPEDVVARGIELGLAVPLDKLGPSIAMLPSADQAMVAFSEVTSFVRFYVDTEDKAGQGGALPRLLAAIRSGSRPDQALVAASGADLKTWDGRWRALIASRPVVKLPELFGLQGKAGDRAQADKLRDLRDRSRLAQLLLSRGHAEEAVGELDGVDLAKAPGSGGSASERWAQALHDPSERWLLARALEETGNRSEGESLVSDPRQVVSSFGPWWALRGRWARLRGDGATAAQSFHEAVAADPLDPEAACETLDPSESPPETAQAPLCAAARSRHEPPFDGD